MKIKFEYNKEFEEVIPIEFEGEYFDLLLISKVLPISIKVAEL